jgi:hypothetical protein
VNAYGRLSGRASALDAEWAVEAPNALTASRRMMPRKIPVTIPDAKASQII